MESLFPVNTKLKLFSKELITSPESLRKQLSSNHWMLYFSTLFPFLVI